MNGKLLVVAIALVAAGFVGALFLLSDRKPRMALNDFGEPLDRAQVLLTPEELAQEPPRIVALETEETDRWRKREVQVTLRIMSLGVESPSADRDRKLRALHEERAGLREHLGFTARARADRTVTVQLTQQLLDRGAVEPEPEPGSGPAPLAIPEGGPASLPATSTPEGP
ncbi:MAG: hypothetical protein ACYS22_16890 [Planctomycetota bacterium]|jgi:hypothetical protein